ncbi:MAG: hypothetical protein J6P44_04045 [Bacteroidales bacterium]|nr:hypothetical protein [Bacteroidales bacterium]
MFTEYSLWFLPLILLVASGFAYFVYFFKQKDKAAFTLRQKYLLAALRFLGIFLILFLLISPVKRIKNKTIEKPVVVLLQDNSSSLSAVKQSDYYKTKYVDNLQKLSNNLSKDYNIVRLLLGSKTIQLKDEIKYKDTLKFNDFATDISQAMEFINENFSSENLSAVVLASDGIATQGSNFLNLTDKFSCPVYTVAMGDTAVRKDVFISDVQYNKIAFVDTDYPIEVTIRADKALGETSSLFMVKDGKTTQIKSFTVDNNDYSVTAELQTASKKAGIEKISLYVSEINGESNKVNNRKDIFIEVLDAKKKVLILANAPHPDISAIKTALTYNQNYTVDVNIAGNNQNNPADYDLVVLHSLPDNAASYNTIKTLLDKGVNMLFITGQSTNIQLFNSLKTGIQINTLSSSLNNVTASYNPSFSLFTVTEDMSNILKDLPPMLTNTAKYTVNGNIQTLLYQKIGAVSTTYPLIAFNNDANSKIGFILGENIWRWRLQNYLINQSTDQIDGLISKTSQLLSDKTDKNRFRIEHKDVYQRNENVIFTAQFYNESFELINTPEITLNIQTQSSNNKSSDMNATYTFGKNNNAYYLNMSSLPEGEYAFTAKTVYNNKEYKQSGRFAVSSVNTELTNLVAKHSDLYTLSSKTDAAMLYPENILDLEKMIKQNGNIKPIIHVSTENRKFISLWWYWALIILTLGGEWFLRKYFGKI